jgi:hypothetical protein
MLQMGFDPGWYHGTTGDIERFRTDLLGEATGAASAKKGFFFARDPINPPQEMLQKSNDPKAIELLKKAGKTDDEIAELNKILNLALVLEPPLVTRLLVAIENTERQCGKRPWQRKNKTGMSTRSRCLLRKTLQ